MSNRHTRSDGPGWGRGTALYRAHGPDGALLYVGISDDPIARLSSHRRDSEWAPMLATFTIEWHRSRRAAEAAETAAIRAERPRWNIAKVTRKPSRWADPSRFPSGVDLLPSGVFRARFTYRGERHTSTWNTAPEAAAWIQHARGALALGLPLPDSSSSPEWAAVG